MTTLKLGTTTRTIDILDRTPRVLEGRTVRDAAEMRDFLTAAIAAARHDNGGVVVLDDTVNFDQPLDMRLVRKVLSDGSVVYDIAVSRW